MHIHGFSSLDTWIYKAFYTTVNGYYLLLCDKINDHHYWLRVYCYAGQIYRYTIFNILILYSWSNKLLLLFAYTHLPESIATATTNPPNAKH